MTASTRLDPRYYDIPEAWIPGTGGLAYPLKEKTSGDETFRVALYNQNVLYHQNLEVFSISQSVSKYGTKH